MSREAALLAEGGGSVIEAHAAEGIIREAFGDGAGGVGEDVRAAQGIIPDSWATSLGIRSSEHNVCDRSSATGESTQEKCDNKHEQNNAKGNTMIIGKISSSYII
jgi:hypothetical protein